MCKCPLTLDGVGACELVWEDELSPGLRGGFWSACSNAAPRPPLPKPDGTCPPEAMICEGYICLNYRRLN